MTKGNHDAVKKRMDGDKEEVASDVADCLRTVEKDGSKADNNLSGNCFDLDSFFFFAENDTFLQINILWRCKKLHY